jgi:alpha-ketoglutarate-dependent 2,4-dichlorophenoxyacetate dioxygenase
MAISIFPVTDSFAAEIGEIDLREPIGASDLAAVRHAFARYAVLIFPAQTLSGDDHLRFAANFGVLEKTVQLALKDQPLRVREEFADIANMDAQGRVWAKDSRLRLFQMGNRLWHTDSSFKAPTAYASMLYSRSIPPIGGHTEFADLRAAYDALAAPMQQQLDGLIAHHSLMYSRAKLGFTEFTDGERQAFAPVRRPLVRTIPESGRRSLYIASHIGRIEGMDDAAADALFKQLTAHATQRQFVYTHRWRVGDLVMWDNRCSMHRGTAFDDTRWPRDMQRATTSDSADAFGVMEAPTTAAADY